MISRGTEASIEVEETLVAALDTINKATEEETGTPEPAVAVATPVLRDSLSTYERITETYFLGRRYTYLSKRKMNAFYRAVVEDHQAVVSQFGKATVLKVMKSAEARANYQSCNGVGETRLRQVLPRLQAANKN